MKPFVVNRHGHLVFPSNFFPELDFSAFADASNNVAYLGLSE